MMTNRDTTNQPAVWLTAATRLLGEDITVQSGPDRTVRAAGDLVRIRVWEAPATVDRVTAIRSMMGGLPDDADVPHPVGENDAVEIIGGRVYDACTVIAGQPLNRNGVFEVPGYGAVYLPLHESAEHGDMLTGAARVLAGMHAESRDRSGLADVGRTDALAHSEVVRAEWQEARKRLGGQAEPVREVRRWLRCGNRVLPVARERLEEAGDAAHNNSVLIHDNIWPAFLMVDNPSRPTELHGITGWESAIAGSPVLDLAALAVRVTGWSEGNVEAILAAYRDHAPLKPVERRLVPVVAAVDLLQQVGRMLEIAYLDDAIANDPVQPFLRGGIRVMLRSLERLTNVLAPPEPPRRSFGPRAPKAADRRSSTASQTRKGEQTRRRSSGRRRRKG